MKKRILCLLLTLALVLPMLVLQMPQVSADKKEPKRSIAIVFDNSGSMYYGDNEQAWCRATYAMEVFASMLNEGDTMEIHPMNPATLGGSGTVYTYGDNPLKINGPKDAQKIRDLFMEVPSQLFGGYGASTPIESIPAAYKSLKKMSGEQKYLIVLTDGNIFYQNGSQLDDDENNPVNTVRRLHEELDAIHDVESVMYLGIGPAVELQSKDSKHDYTVARNTKNTLTELTRLCNKIFGRARLEKAGSTVSFDVSMSKVIVFAQGAGISSITLDGQQGMQVATKYSERGIDTTKVIAEHGDSTYYQSIKAPGVPDKDLQGMIATYENVAVGDHDLQIAGGDFSNVEIYYEPNVELFLECRDEQGNLVDPSAKEYNAGKYTLKWYMRDAVTKEETNSSLLKDPAFDINLWIKDENGNLKKELDADKQGNSVELELAAGDKLTGEFKVNYLTYFNDEYTMDELGWGDGLRIIPRQVGELTLQINPSSSQTYPLSQFAELAKYEVQLYCQGELVSGDALDRAQLQVSLEGGDAKVSEPKKGENGWTVTLGYNGDAMNTKCGEYTLKFQAQYTNEDNQSATTTGAAAFLLEDDSHGMKVKLQLEEDYYVLSSLEDAPPIYANLTTDGAPMEPDQFDKVTVSVTIEGLTKGTHYSWTPEKENARYVLRFLPGSDIDTTDYTIQVKATGLNEIGKEITASDSAEVSFNSYPLWVKILFWSLLFIILLTLWILWRNSKRLPKNVKMVPGMRFVVDGETVPGDTSPKKSGFGGKRGSMTVSAPDYMLMPMASSSCGFTLTLEAKSPRKTKSASRSAWVVGVRVADPMATESLTIGTESFIIDKETLKVYSAMNGPDEPIRFDIGGTTNFVVTSEIPSSNGRGTVSCTLTGEFEFC